MVLVSDKKYACETCIKGHRSSACKHTDRPLFEIKKKGRPVTQCEHCRELRKTKQVHVKCLCGVQDLSTHSNEASHSKKGAAKLPAIAAFPHGLPEDLEAVAILPAASDGSVDSDHSGETSPSGCRCTKGEQCDCCTPRKPPGRRRSSVHRDVVKPDRHLHSHHHHPESSHIVKDPTQPLSSHVLARIAELRPVLPRPPRSQPLDGPLHDPSSSIPHTLSNRHHTHENMYYSPYGRAYEHAHTPDHHEPQPTPQTGDTRASPMRQQPPMQQNMLPGTQYTFDAWQPAPDVFPSACTCGDSCRCPGCSQHSNAPIPPGGAYSTCANPASCSFCLDCTILSLPSSSVPPSIDFASDSQTREFEEWLRQVSGSPTTTTGPVGMQTSFTPYELSMNQMAAFPNPNHTRSPQLPSPAEASCHHGRCNCPRGSCTCASRSSGCSPNCDGDHRSSGSTSRTTYAVSGERPTTDKPPDPPSSSGMSRRNASIRVPDYMTMTTMRDGLTASVNMRSPPGYYPDQANYLSMAEAPSRSSSSSSLSSRMSGRSPISSNTPAVFHNGPSVSSRSPQPRPAISTNNYGAYAQPQPMRPGGQYNAYPFGSMQFPQ